jgi:hypothetical protein
MDFYTHKTYSGAEILKEVKKLPDLEEKSIIIGGLPFFNLNQEIRFSAPGKILISIGSKEYFVKVKALPEEK